MHCSECMLDSPIHKQESYRPAPDSQRVPTRSHLFSSSRMCLWRRCLRMCCSKNLHLVPRGSLASSTYTTRPRRDNGQEHMCASSWAIRNNMQACIQCVGALSKWHFLGRTQQVTAPTGLTRRRWNQESSSQGGNCLQPCRQGSQLPAPSTVIVRCSWRNMRS